MDDYGHEQGLSDTRGGPARRCSLTIKKRYEGGTGLRSGVRASMDFRRIRRIPSPVPREHVGAPRRKCVTEMDRYGKARCPTHRAFHPTMTCLLTRHVYPMIHQGGCSLQHKKFDFAVR